MWKDLEKGFQAAFEEAWDTFVVGNFPIGAAIINQTGEVVAKGRNQISTPGDGLISRHQLAHAEINAILKLSEDEYPDIRTYTLYTTLEPCPLCFGAVVMGSIKHIKFAARDTLGGATNLNNATPYLVSKRIVIEGPFPESEFIQRALSVCRLLEKSETISEGYKRVLEREKTDGPRFYEAGEVLFTSGVIKGFVDSNTRINEVYDYICHVTLERGINFSIAKRTEP